MVHMPLGLGCIELRIASRGKKKKNPLPTINHDLLDKDHRHTLTLIPEGHSVKTRANKRVLTGEVSDLLL